MPSILNLNFPHACRLVRGILLSAGLVFLYLPASAQLNFYIPASSDSLKLKMLMDKHSTSYYTTIKNLPQKYKKELTEQYSKRWDNISYKFEIKELYTGRESQEYLDKIVSEIIFANPFLKELNFSCYFSRSGNPNASYIGEGMILFNIGLFQRMENESQVAFVLCHEIAHFLLKHSESSINEYVSKINSDEVQQALKKIKGSAYRKREQVENLVEELSFDSRRHTRSNEHQADSLAVELLKNTRFSSKESLSALSLLDSIDMNILDTEFLLRQMFDAKDYPFQTKWLRKETGLLGGHARLTVSSIADSLKTHPDCQKRIAQLQPMIPAESDTDPVNIIDENYFSILQTISGYEIIEFAYNQENYSESLYYCLWLYKVKPEDPYLVTMIGKNLNALFNAVKFHRIGQVADLPSPHYSESYNNLCQFIQNLYAENIAGISFHFLQKFKNNLSQFESFNNVFEESKKIKARS